MHTIAQMLMFAMLSTLWMGCADTHYGNSSATSAPYEKERNTPTHTFEPGEPGEEPAPVFSADTMPSAAFPLCEETWVRLHAQGDDVPFVVDNTIDPQHIFIENEHFGGNLFSEEFNLLVQFVGLDAQRLTEGAVFNGQDFRLFMGGNIHPDQDDVCSGVGHEEETLMAIQVHTPQPGDPMVIYVEGVMSCGQVEAEIELCVVSEVPEPAWLVDGEE
ncbi:MAG: hypothetical protein AAFX99_12730 [Myxococcota bacterium]